MVKRSLRRFFGGGLALALLVGCQPGEPPLEQSSPMVVVTFPDHRCDEQCDSTGKNCAFPIWHCGTQSCDVATNEIHTQVCDGKGACSGYAPAPCLGHVTCADAVSCIATCTQPTDCVAGYTCQSGSCASSN